MNESLAAACGEFEQVLLAGMLRSASFARPPAADPTEEGDDAPAGESSDAFAELMTQAIAGAVERAGGVGLRANLVAALTRSRS